MLFNLQSTRRRDSLPRVISSFQRTKWTSKQRRYRLYIDARFIFRTRLNEVELRILGYSKQEQRDRKLIKRHNRQREKERAILLLHNFVIT